MLLKRKKDLLRMREKNSKLVHRSTIIINHALKKTLFELNIHYAFIYQEIKKIVWM